MITRTESNGDLDQIPGIGDHRPEWESFDCPSCGSAPCGPHPMGLICDECAEEWPCDIVQIVAAQLDELAAQLDSRAARREAVADDDGPACDGECETSDCHTVSAVATWQMAAGTLRRRVVELRGGAE